ncbi:MAG: hypothetical protein ABL994_16735 [Verrucomicrobiales bacterium]
MKTARLNPEFRSRMRELIQGFIEHCEFSQSLIGQIERFVKFRGLKYGLPTFTVYGPSHQGLETSVINLIGLNDDADDTTGETLLQLIERLVLQPHVATGHVLRILPVSNPIAFENGDPISDSDTLSSLDEALENFRSSRADGTIELKIADRPQLALSVSGPVSILNVVSSTGEAMRRLQREESPDFNAVVTRDFRGGDGWHLTIEIPRHWNETLAVHWTSQALVVFLRTHLDSLVLKHSHSYI